MIDQKVENVGTFQNRMGIFFSNHKHFIIYGVTLIYMNAEDLFSFYI